MMVARMVGFDKNGLAVGAGFSSVVETTHYRKVMYLPSMHVDFINYDVRGKTEAQIVAETAMVES